MGYGHKIHFVFNLAWKEQRLGFMLIVEKNQGEWAAVLYLTPDAI